METNSSNFLVLAAEAARRVAQFIGLSFAAVAVLSNIANAQTADTVKSKPAPWVPYNGASELINNPASVPMRPSEIGLAGSVSDKSTTFGTLSSCKQEFGGFAVGMGTSISRTTDSKGASTDNADLRLAAGTSEFQAGIRLPYADAGKGFEPGQPSVQVRTLNQDIGGIRVRAGLDVAPRTQKQSQGATASADFIKEDIALSTAIFTKDGKKPNGAFGLEANLGKGFQIGASLHPEREFFNGRMQPNLMLRWTSKNSTFNANYMPHQNQVKVGVGLRF